MSNTTGSSALAERISTHYDLDIVDDSDYISADEIIVSVRSAMEALDEKIAAIKNKAELTQEDLMELQTLVAERGMRISLASNILASLHQTAAQVISNTR